MIVTAESAKESACYGTLNLAQSLLRSRCMWLTSAFVCINQSDMEKPQHLIDTVEVQIGPHIYPNTKFYYVSDLAPTAADSQSQALSTADVLSPPLAFEFGDNPGTLFCLPKDLGIESSGSDSSGTIRAYFYADPTRPLRRLPSIINQEWLDYHIGERTLTRINLVIRNTNAALVEYLAKYTAGHSTLVWRQYRTQAAQLYPTVRRWPSFFPAKQLPESMRAEPTAISLRPPPSVTIRRPRVCQAKPPLPSSQQGSQMPVAPYTGGGKSGYNLAVAAAQKRYMLECDSDSSSSSSSSNEQMEDVAETAEHENVQFQLLQKPLGSVPVRSYTPPPAPTLLPPRQGAQPVKTVAKRPYKRRTPVIQKTPSSSNPRRITLSPVVGRGRKCSYCGCNETPIWRRGPAGTGTLCNACGVRWKLGKILQ
ncbi:hypothetical protein GGI20_002325 [Coemansia sp. BCRC 34301]|nr:hypothetical protein GGI20_002325 [Coemansia sp. BCRC 34301]